MRLQRMKLSRWIDEGCATQWWEGHAYWDYATLRRRVAAVPLNYLIQLAWSLNLIWARLTNRPSWIDRHVKAAIDAQRNVWL